MQVHWALETWRRLSDNSNLFDTIIIVHALILAIRITVSPREDPVYMIVPFPIISMIPNASDQTKVKATPYRTKYSMT